MSPVYENESYVGLLAVFQDKLFQVIYLADSTGIKETLKLTGVELLHM